MFERGDWSRAGWRRRLEVISIVLLALFSMAALILNEWLSGKRVDVGQESPLVYAQANAMPNRGWAPLQVYFSAFGIQSEGNTIIRYEWDLDGNGSLEFDFSRHAQCKACTTGDGESLLLTNVFTL